MNESPTLNETSTTRRSPSLTSQALFGLGIVVHLIFLFSLRTGWLNGLFNDSSHTIGQGCDFYSIYLGAMRGRYGDSVFVPGHHPASVPYGYAFRYAPMVAYAFIPATILPARAAYVVWIVVCELILLRNVLLTVRQSTDRSRSLAAASMWLLFSPYYLELYVGQFTFVTASLMFWAYLGWEEKSRSADLFYGASILMKIFPVIYAPVAFLRDRNRATLVALLLLTASSMAYFSVFHDDWYIFCNRNFGLAPWGTAGNLGLSGLLWAVWSGHSHVYLIARGAATCVVLIMAAIPFIDALKADRSTPAFEAAILRAYAACSSGYLLAYRDVWEHHYTLLLPPLVLMALRRHRPIVWLPSFLVAALPTLFSFVDIPGIGRLGDPQAHWSTATSLLYHAGKPIAALWLLVGAAASTRKQSNGEPQIPDVKQNGEYHC